MVDALAYTGSQFVTSLTCEKWLSFSFSRSNSANGKAFYHINVYQFKRFCWRNHWFVVKERLISGGLPCVYNHYPPAWIRRAFTLVSMPTGMGLTLASLPLCVLYWPYSSLVSQYVGLFINELKISYVGLKPIELAWRQRRGRNLVVLSCRVIDAVSQTCGLYIMQYVDE